MSYINLTDLTTRYGAEEMVNLADRDGDSIPDEDVIAVAIGDAEAMIDSHLAGRYTLPLNPVPAVIVRMTCAITRYHLYDDKPTQAVTQEYQAALSALAKIGSGELALIQAAGQGQAPDYLAGSPQFDDIGEY